LDVPIIAVGTPKILLGVLNGLHYMYKKLVPTYLDEYKLIEIKPIVYIIYYIIIYISQILGTHSLIHRYILKTIKRTNLKFGLVVPLII